MNKFRYFGTGLAALLAWGAAYAAALPLARELAGLLSAGNARFGAALEFFFYDTGKILLLLVLMVYGIGWLRAGLHADKVRDYLAGKGRGVGYVLGAGFGAVTPFCSCSSIPLFLGFATARIPLGITMAFLITSPLINEIAVILLWGLLGWKFTLLYVLVGLGAGILGGIIMDALRAERWLQPFLLDARQPGGSLKSLRARHVPRPDLSERHAFAWAETIKIFRKVWLWVLIGVSLGALLHGYVPRDWFAAHLGAGQWWSVPLAVTLGIPLYTNVTGIVPVMESLLLKGLPLGTTLAFCMSTVAASLPEALMLKQVMRWQLLALFLGILLVIFTLTGWLFNLLPLQIC
ncbi:MAG: permease [Desulfovibrio sp.]|uniref:permease n=1 Tax=Desulfovibrio sp. TaxID=885 RepID=UPI0025902725|nr:permease [Desulfovibrio sp.]MCD7984167.1 permease [Desulfovibrio sp.]